MDKLGLRKSLISAGIFRKKYSHEDDVQDYPAEQIIKIDGYNYLVDDGNLVNEEIVIALLAKQTQYLKSLRFMVRVFFIIFMISLVSYLILCLARII